MKAIKDNKTYTIQEAVEYTLEPSPYTCDGEIENLRAKCKLQSEMMAKLISHLVNHTKVFDGQRGEINLEELLEWGFTVEKE